MSEDPVPYDPKGKPFSNYIYEEAQRRRASAIYLGYHEWNQIRREIEQGMVFDIDIGTLPGLALGKFPVHQVDVQSHLAFGMPQGPYPRNPAQTPRPPR